MSWGTLGLRLAIVVAAIIGIWRGASMLWGDTHDPATHLLRGACISLMVLALVALLLRLDRLRGSEIGQLGPAANVRAFALGAGLWLLPALVGAALCIALGWASISLRSTPSTILLALPPLALGVFLVEAFPEELALRGYVQGLVARKAAPWVALLAQMVVFVGFGWAVGALHSVEQWMFIPGLALILGYVRALTGNVWASMGVHCAWMTSTQLLNGHAAVEGLQTLQFLAFALLPSATIGAALGVLNPGFSWRRAAAA
ncbi:CPBP family intramembrane glutamic endopeptidase [Luteimonas soli]|uniref:CPBP family intramembrane glutamic endopeptidase n=1 Tax=Luteimonas soli TaxID=1648966 RepID=A0ABV7XH24_9GAMM